MRNLFAVFIVFLGVGMLRAEVQTGYLIPHPSAARDFALGGSTISLSWAPQSVGANPAGLELFEPSPPLRGTIVLSPAAVPQVTKLWRDGSRSTPDKLFDSAGMLVHGVGMQKSILVLMALFAQPVLREGEFPENEAFEGNTLDGLYSNSVLFKLDLHPQVAVGGRVDRFYEDRHPMASAHGYGVILRRKSVQVGLQYQRYPAQGNFAQHPLDRRGDQTTSAALSWKGHDFSVSFQVLNLTQKSEPALLEPHAGVEWRPFRAVAFRAGGAQFSRSNCWAWTAGLGLLDANWLRGPLRRLKAPDDILQLAAGVIYRKHTPLSVTGIMTLAWRL